MTAFAKERMLEFQSVRSGDSEPWRDPIRVAETLASFALTEAEGARDIAAALRRVNDPWLIEHLRRHAEDEKRHAELFSMRVAELRREHAAIIARAVEPRFDRDLPPPANSRDPRAKNAHGFLPGAFIESAGEVAYLAMLHVAETRAADLFTKLAEVTTHDSKTQAVFRAIVKDEHYHVSYTKAALDRYRASGRGNDVALALAEASGNRRRAAWRRLGSRAGATFGRVVLRVSYFTVLAPFAWLAKRRAPETEASPPRRPIHLESQYE